MTSTAHPFPWPRGGPLLLPPEYDRLRGTEPVAQVEFANGERSWVLTRHDLVRRILIDPRISSEHSHPGFPPVFPVAKHRTDGTGVPRLLTYSGMDRPEHAVHRRRVNGEFTTDRIAGLRPSVEQIVEDHVTAILDGPRPADLVPALAEPVPARVIAELLGIPPADRAPLRELSRIVLSHGSGPERVRAASTELRALISSVLAGMESGAGDGLLSRLIRRYRAADAYDHAQMIEFTGALITAGHETTANMIALGMLALLQHPDQLAQLADEPALLRGAVEELLRYLSIADLVTARVALEDIEIGGITIRAGEGVLALGAAADHDPEVFVDPEILDIRRDAGRHVAFGHGIHKCLGEHLARLELEVVFTALLARIPGMRLAVGADELRVRDAGVLHGLAELPITW